MSIEAQNNNKQQQAAGQSVPITHVTYVLPGPQRTLLECLRCFKLALPAVQCSQIPEGSGDGRTVHFSRLVPAAILAVWCVVFPALSVILQRRLGTRPKFPFVRSSQDLGTTHQEIKDNKNLMYSYDLYFFIFFFLHFHVQLDFLTHLGKFQSIKNKTSEVILF